MRRLVSGRAAIRGTSTVGALAAVLVLVMAAGAASAAGVTDSAGPLATPAAAEPAGGPMRLVAWLSERQRIFQQTVVDALKALRGGTAPRAFAILVGAGFLYGVVHAAGPGHGKAIVSSYLLTHPADRRQALVIVAAAALLQGLVAIALVGGMIGILDLAARQTRDAARWAEIASFGLVAAVGLILLARAVGRAGGRLRWRHVRRAGNDGHGHGSQHDGTHACCAPNLEAVAGARGPLAVAGLILACGVRPCAGAILVLVLAFAMDLAAAGIAAVLAMSVGTGLTVAAVAFGSRAVRLGAVSLGERLGLGPAAAWTGIAATAVGGLLVTATGALLLAAAFQPRHPLL